MPLQFRLFFKTIIVTTIENFAAKSVIVIIIIALITIAVTVNTFTGVIIMSSKSNSKVKFDDSEAISVVFIDFHLLQSFFIV